MGRRRHLLMLVAGIAILPLIALMEVRTSRVHLLHYEIPGICAIREVSGMPCPGCGLTRSVVAAGHLDFSESLRFHPAGWIVFLLFCLHIPYRIARLSTSLHDSSLIVSWSTNVARVGLTVVLVVGVVRCLL